MEEEGFEAVFIGSGAGLPRFMGIPGEQANGVFSANEFQQEVTSRKLFKEGHETPISKKGKKECELVGGWKRSHGRSQTIFVSVQRHTLYRECSEAELPTHNREVHNNKEIKKIIPLP